MHRRAVGLAAVILLVAMLAPAPATAQRADSRTAEADVGVRRLPADYKYPDISLRDARRMVRQAASPAAASQQAAAVGDTVVLVRAG